MKRRCGSSWKSAKSICSTSLLWVRRHPARRLEPPLSVARRPEAGMPRMEPSSLSVDSTSTMDEERIPADKMEKATSPEITQLHNARRGLGLLYQESQQMG